MWQAKSGIRAAAYKLMEPQQASSSCWHLPARTRVMKSKLVSYYSNEQVWTNWVAAVRIQEVVSSKTLTNRQRGDQLIVINR